MMLTFITTLIVNSPLILSQPQATSVNFRVTGGYHCKPEDYPYLVSLYYRHKDYICGGTLIRPDYVLSAAHCCRHKDIIATTGSIIVRSMKQQYAYQRRYFRHPEYTDILSGNDVCVIQLSDKIKEQETIKEVTLADPPTWEYMYNNSLLNNCLIMGFGNQISVSEESNPTRKLKCGNISVVSEKFCARIPNGALCAFDLLSGGVTNGCKGDSGGPLICNGVQVGIVSFGIQCGKYPAVYTRVDSHIDFIHSVIGDKELSSSGIVHKLETIVTILISIYLTQYD